MLSVQVSPFPVGLVPGIAPYRIFFFFWSIFHNPFPVNSLRKNSNEPNIQFDPPKRPLRDDYQCSIQKHMFQFIFTFYFDTVSLSHDVRTA